MMLVFGKKMCSGCQAKVAELKKQKKNYEYYDLETPEGLSVAAYYGVLGNRSLPIIVEIGVKGAKGEGQKNEK